MSNPLKELKLALTTVRVDTGSGLLLQPDCGASDAYIRRVRVWNFIEPYLVFGLMMAVVWISKMDKHVWWFMPSAIALVPNSCPQPYLSSVTPRLTTCSFKPAPTAPVAWLTM